MSVDSSSGRMMKIGPKFMDARATRENPDAKLREVSEMYEKHFLREMMKAMRSTVGESGLIKTNQAEKIFQEQLDHNYVDKWGEKGGIGLSEMIYKQLVDKYGVQMGLKLPEQKPQGPIALDAKSNFNVNVFHSSKIGDANQADRTVFKFEREKGVLGSKEALSLRNPWKGRLLSSYELPSGESLVEILHDKGATSKLVFKGLRSSLENGTEIKAGDTVGYLSQGENSVWWNLDAKKSDLDQGQVDPAQQSSQSSVE
jgi:peptidoglycan hydrolase FlgJ